MSTSRTLTRMRGRMVMRWKAMWLSRSVISSSPPLE
jgi:hypothetical protein